MQEQAFEYAYSYPRFQEMRYKANWGSWPAPSVVNSLFRAGHLQFVTANAWGQKRWAKKRRPWWTISGVWSSVHLIVSILLNFCCCLRLLTLALPFPLELSRTAGDWGRGAGPREIALTVAKVAGSLWVCCLRLICNFPHDTHTPTYL